MNSKELNHNLDLIKIHQEVIQIQEKTRTEMGSLCPPYIIKDISDRKKEVKRITNAILGSEHRKSPVIDELREIAQMDDVSDIHLFKVIELVQLLLNDKSSSLGSGNTNIKGSKNVVANSQITGNNIHIGDIIKIESILKEEDTTVLDKNIDELKLLISVNKIKEALEVLLVKSKSSPDLSLQNSVVSLTNRWNSLQQRAYDGLLTEESLFVGSNRIVRSMLEIINKL